MGQLRPYPGFVGPSYTSQSKIACDDRTVNWIPAKIESGTGPAEYVFDPAPGFAAFCETGTNVGRAIFTLNGVTWAIFGSNLFQLPLFAGGTPTLLGQSLNNPDNAPAQMVGNGDAGGQLLIMSGSTKYFLTIGAPLSVTTDLDPPVLIGSGTSSVGGSVPAGYFAYAVTFVNAAGETVPGPRLVVFNPGTGDPAGGTETLDGVPLGPASAGVTSRKIYRTAAQITAGAAFFAQLKLLATIADNTTIQAVDTSADASLGANAPTTNTATVTLTALTQLPDPATQIAFLDGYGLALDANRSEVRFSGLEDFSTWDPLDVFQRNDLADKWLAMIVVHKEIWLFGSQTSSVYYNSGDVDIPFVPNPSVSIARGTIAPFSVGLLNGSPIWLADDLTVRYAQGYTPQRVSTHAVEYAIAQMNTVFDAWCSVYQEQGHTLYVLNFPTADQTWVYDLTSGLWHERGVWNGLDFDVMNVTCCAATSTANLVLARTGSQVFEMAQTFAVETDGMTGLRRVRRAPHLNKSLNRIRYARMRLLMEVGLGLSSGQGSDPQIMLRYSDDGGQSFGGETLASAGPIGDYGTIPEWFQLGQARDRVFELSVSDPIPWRLVDAYLDFSEGAS